MPKTHTVAQGETLTRIARQYKYSSWKKIYEHPDNAEFRALRENPDIIFPGDKIIIPDIEPKKMSARAGKGHTFCLKRETEVFKLRVLDSYGEPVQQGRVVVEVGDEKHDIIMLDNDGIIEIPLNKGDEATGKIEVYADASDEKPSQVFEVQLAHLDPVEELSGVQARCNLLGHDCGVADGIMGSKTRAGVKSFQAAHGLDVDGVPGPLTKAKLKEVYGS